MNNIISINKGYVRLVTYMPFDMYNLERAIVGGDLDSAKSFLTHDLTVVNAARGSFKKEATVLEEKDRRLLSFLAREKHESPLRHAYITFEIKAPLMVARQWFKYRVGSSHSGDTAELIGVPEGMIDLVLSSLFGGNGDDQGFETGHGRNEASRRYITMVPEFYIPDVWRKKPDNLKQGSGDDLSVEDSRRISNALELEIRRGINFYEHLLKIGVAPEQARLALPAAYGLYTVWRWTCSLQSVIHFLKQRLKSDSQKEIQDYAKAVRDLSLQAYPEVLKRWLNEEKE